MSRQKIPKKSSRVSDSILELVRSYLLGPMEEISLHIKEIIASVENKCNKHEKVFFFSDGDGKIISKDIEHFFKIKVIKHQMMKKNIEFGKS